MRAGLLDCYDIDDMKIRMGVTDTAAALSYGTIYDGPGINEMNLEVQMTESTSYGDGGVLDHFSRAKMINGSVKQAWLSHELFAAIMAGQSRHSGTTPNEKLETAFGSVNTPWFEMDYQCKYVGPNGALYGDAHTIAHKCRVTKINYAQKMESRHEVSFDWVGIPLINLESGWNFRRCWTFVENETAIAQTAGAADTSAPTISSFVPTAAATGIAVGTTLVFTFNEALDPTSVNEEHFLLATAAGVYVTFSTITLNAAGTTVTCTPTSALSAATQYRWTVTRGVRNLAGIRLAANNTNTFTTA